MRARTATILAVILFTLASGCSDETKRPPQEPAADYDALVQQAWAAFDSGDYDSARAIFNQLIASFPDAAEGHTGFGWCEIVEQRLESALAALLEADRLGGGADAAAGLAVAASALGRDEIALEAAARVEDPSYVFSGDPQFTFRDLLYIRALAEFHLLRYEDCYSTLNILMPDLWIDFDEYDFREQLFAALESLEGRV